MTWTQVENIQMIYFLFMTPSKVGDHSTYLCLLFKLFKENSHFQPPCAFLKSYDIFARLCKLLGEVSGFPLSPNVGV